MTTEEEIAALRKELAETRELATVATKAAISALAALARVTPAANRWNNLPDAERVAMFRNAAETVKSGLDGLKDFIEGDTDAQS